MTRFENNSRAVAGLRPSHRIGLPGRHVGGVGDPRPARGDVHQSPGDPRLAWSRRVDAVLAPPRGITLAAVLICLLIVMLFSSVLVRALALRQRALRWDEQQLQCLFLIESAVERTKVQCAAEPKFSGETWIAALDDHGVARVGIAQIRVEPVANEPRQRQVQIEARWPDDPVLRVQRTKQLIITLPVSGAAS